MMGREPYEPPRVDDLGSLSEITLGSGMGRRDNGTSDGAGKT
jgi:hypothetical protein